MTIHETALTVQDRRLVVTERNHAFFSMDSIGQRLMHCNPSEVLRDRALVHTAPMDRADVAVPTGTWHAILTPTSDSDANQITARFVSAFS